MSTLNNKQQILSEIHRLVKKDDHKAIIQYCNKAISSGIKDDDILESKIIASLHAHQVSRPEEYHRFIHSTR